MNIPFQILMVGAIGFLSLAGGLVGVYVQLTNQLTRDKVRIDALEKKAEIIERAVDNHYEKFNVMFAKIQEDIHAVRLLIEQRPAPKSPKGT